MRRAKETYSCTSTPESRFVGLAHDVEFGDVHLLHVLFLCVCVCVRARARFCACACPVRKKEESTQTPMKKGGWEHAYPEFLGGEKKRREKLEEIGAGGCGERSLPTAPSLRVSAGRASMTDLLEIILDAVFGVELNHFFNSFVWEFVEHHLSRFRCNKAEARRHQCFGVGSFRYEGYRSGNSTRLLIGLRHCLIVCGT